MFALATTPSSFDSKLSGDNMACFMYCLDVRRLGILGMGCNFSSFRRLLWVHDFKNQVLLNIKVKTLKYPGASNRMAAQK